MLLAIDTSAGTSVAVLDDRGDALAVREVTDTMRHAELIGTLIAETLAEARTRPSGLDGVACGVGPGPFTGLRVGIAAARVFAFGAGLPLLPVVSHDAIALADGGGGPFLVVTDARRRERYWSAYDGVDELGLPIRIDGPGLAKPDALPHPALRRVEALGVPAAPLGRIAVLRAAHGLPPAPAEPLYLRSPDVTLATGRKRVS